MLLKKRYILISLSVVLMTDAVVFEFSGRKADASREDESLLPTAAVQLATRGSIRSSITLSGDFRPYQEVVVHAKVAGCIRNCATNGQ
jgi:multidrug efflux pump subunit AcrA (membrane-fusion protein)